MTEETNEPGMFGDGDEIEPLYIGYESGQGDIYITSTELQLNELDDAAQKYDFASRSEAARYFMNLGMRSFVANDPRNQSRSESDNAVTIRELIPEGKENAISIRDELSELIDDNILDIVDNDPEINRDGWEVYR